MTEEAPGKADGSQTGELTPPLNYRQRMTQAIAQCDAQFRWYEGHSRSDWWLFRSFQIAILLLSGSTPVLILFTSLPKPVQALPAAVATLVAAIGGSFHWHEDAVRWAATRELLRSEIEQFKVRAGQYPLSLPDEKALNSFVARTQAIALREVQAWQVAELSTGKTDGSNKNDAERPV